MKNICLLMIAVFLISCGSSDDCSLDQTISFYQGATLKICDDMIHDELQGIDSEVGRIKRLDGTLQINYDIGGLAGLYIGENEQKTTDQSVNQEFWYKTRDSTLIITFPLSNGDTTLFYSGYNFTSHDLDEKELILDIMRTFDYQ